MYTCADCAVLACYREGKEMPGNCPMKNTELFAESMQKYRDKEIGKFFLTAAAIEAEGYCVWPRVKETIEFCRRMGYSRIGMAFCVGLRREAKVIASLLREHGFTVESVVCKTGGIAKSEVGIPPEHQVEPGKREAMCNPIAQAKLLNAAGTEFNLVVGLCVGHDSLFYRYSDAMVTTLIAKDRVLAHNPAGAVYCAEGYFRKVLKSDAR